MKRSLVAVLVSAAVVGGSLGFASSAHAADPAPVCVVGTKARKGAYFVYTVRNNCRSTLRVKVALSLYPDSDCFTLRPGQAFQWSSFSSGYQGNILC